MTYRMVADLIDQLPVTSRTKVSMRDAMDPVELYELCQAQLAKGWQGYGPVSHTDHLIAAVGERLDQLVDIVVKALGGQPDKRYPWSRPGVAGREVAEAIEAIESAPARSQLEIERAERAARRAAYEAEQAALAAQQQEPSPPSA